MRHLLLVKEIMGIMNVSQAYVKFLRGKGVDLQKLCRIFANDHLYIRSKRNYLYALPNISENDKDHIWEALMGDTKLKLYEYEPLYPWKNNKEREKER